MSRWRAEYWAFPGRAYDWLGRPPSPREQENELPWSVVAADTPVSLAAAHQARAGLGADRVGGWAGASSFKCLQPREPTGRIGGEAACCLGIQALQPDVDVLQVHEQRAAYARRVAVPTRSIVHPRLEWQGQHHLSGGGRGNPVHHQTPRPPHRFGRTETGPAQDHLADTFGLTRWAPRTYVIQFRNINICCEQRRPWPGSN